MADDKTEQAPDKSIAERIYVNERIDLLGISDKELDQLISDSLHAKLHGGIRSLAASTEVFIAEKNRRSAEKASTASMKISQDSLKISENSKTIAKIMLLVASIALFLAVVALCFAIFDYLGDKAWRNEQLNVLYEIRDGQ